MDFGTASVVHIASRLASWTDEVVIANKQQTNKVHYGRLVIKPLSPFLIFTLAIFALRNGTHFKTKLRNDPPLHQLLLLLDTQTVTSAFQDLSGRWKSFGSKTFH